MKESVRCSGSHDMVTGKDPAPVDALHNPGLIDLKQLVLPANCSTHSRQSKNPVSVLVYEQFDSIATVLERF